MMDNLIKLNGGGKASNKFIAYFSDFRGQTKYSATGINVALQPGTYVLIGRIVCPGTCWSMQNLNNVNIPMTLDGSTANEFTVTTADSNFNTCYYIDGSYGSVDYVLYQIV